MEAVVHSLEKAIKSATDLCEQIQPQIEDREIEEFSRLCQKFVEIQTKYQIIKALESNELPENISPDDIQKLQTENEEIKQKISQIQRMNENINPNALRELITKSKETLQEITNKLNEGGDPNIDKLARDAKEELAHLEGVAKSNEWYKAAYEKLSKFALIEILDTNSIRLLGTHQVAFQNGAIILTPNNIFIDDIDPKEEPRNICISEIIERLAAFQNLKDAAQKLNWEIETLPNAPVALLHPPSTGDVESPAMFALIGFSMHPLIRWGNVNVDEFNADTKKSIADKIRAFESKA
ncbi:hypothetical protein TRFO_42233 [Tritrichomonas foetus]|uniref:Uncharacterized protein n=1 Tax=Tritrichomonas foetus TaxID=1144522 RepID=A0A1J4KYD9_9EUKA|nr:hypothetical protein TRFO_42233 [Tritrichomonas foetus]|eukprot:OHT15896.1 hypothetical protein TRFO_42233 [Tritrichomonas foetus]